jgi:hypothetical protein
VKRELLATCAVANDTLREHCLQQGFEEYPYIILRRATPQQMRGWLLYHFPQTYSTGRMEHGIIAGKRLNRGVAFTNNGIFYDVAGAQIAGMKKF